VEADLAAQPGQAIFAWRLTNSCASGLDHGDFRFVPGAQVTDLTDDTVYLAPSGRTYRIDVMGGPHAGVNFHSLSRPALASGESDLFRFQVTSADLAPGVVLWNNAGTEDGSSGRMDMRSALCFELSGTAGGAGGQPVGSSNSGSLLAQSAGLLLAATLATRRRQRRNTA
jgi:hypothetical protein